MTTKLQDEQPAAHPGGSRMIAGRYRIERLIARGGMGVVYLAEQVELGRQVALKILKHHSDPEGAGAFQERFSLEARTLAKLDHPNIVTLYDYGKTEDGRYYLALEYIDGPRFTDLIREEGLPPERVVSLLLQVCRALRYSHRKNVIHRDLKPSNLLTQRDDEGREVVKVVDFGLVKVLEDDQSLTQAGLILGSPHCMAPEQVKGLDVDHRADIYAMGVMLFRALTGVWPFHGDSSTATMIAHINEPVPSLRRAAPHLQLPEGMEQIVERCLAKEPEDRYADVGALMQDLQAFAGGTPGEFASLSQLSQHSLASGPRSLSDGPPSLVPDTEEITQPSEPSLMRPERDTAPRRRSALLLALLLVVVGIGGAVGAVAWRLSHPSPTPTVTTQALPVEPPPPPVPDASSAPPPEVTPPAAPPTAAAPPEVTAPVVADPPPSATAPAASASAGGRTTRPPETPKDAPPAEATPPRESSTGPKEEKTPEGYMGLPEDF